MEGIGRGRSRAVQRSSGWRVHSAFCSRCRELFFASLQKWLSHATRLAVWPGPLHVKLMSAKDAFFVGEKRNSLRSNFTLAQRLVTTGWNTPLGSSEGEAAAAKRKRGARERETVYLWSIHSHVLGRERTVPAPMHTHTEAGNRETKKWKNKREKRGSKEDGCAV